MRKIDTPNIYQILIVGIITEVIVVLLKCFGLIDFSWFATVIIPIISINIFIILVVITEIFILALTDTKK